MRLSPIKTDILRLITRAGPDGVPGENIFSIVFEGRAGNFGLKLGYHTLKSHINQINTKLKGFDWRIHSVARDYNEEHRSVYGLVHAACIKKG